MRIIKLSRTLYCLTFSQYSGSVRSSQQDVSPPQSPATLLNQILTAGLIPISRVSWSPLGYLALSLLLREAAQNQSSVPVQVQQMTEMALQQSAGTRASHHIPGDTRGLYGTPMTPGDTEGL